MLPERNIGNVEANLLIMVERLTCALRTADQLLVILDHDSPHFYH